MIREICFPELLSGRELDIFLSKGWFRMGQSIFTTDFARINGSYLPVYWMRIDLEQYHFARSRRKLLAANREYEVLVKPFILTGEAEALYDRYAFSVDFEAPRSIEEFLYFGAGYNIYDSYAIEVRHRGYLIALGIFDRGDDSIAGIMNFYDPAYRAKSLGKYLMLLKMKYAHEQGIKWYYLGYIAGGTTKFDYKLFPDPFATTIYDSYNDMWVPYIPVGQEMVATRYPALVTGMDE